MAQRLCSRLSLRVDMDKIKSWNNLGSMILSNSALLIWDALLLAVLFSDGLSNGIGIVITDLNCA